jgi:hypothetical protein
MLFVREERLPCDRTSLTVTDRTSLTVDSSVADYVPVLGAVKVVPRVGGSTLTAPARRRIGRDGGIPGL